MKPNDDDFANAVNSALKPPEKELPGSFPAAQQKKETFTVKYGRFIVADEDGCETLEKIVNDCLSGKYILASEQMHFTKEGDAIVVIKYLIPSTPEPQKMEGAIHGRRRLKKALREGK